MISVRKIILLSVAAVLGALTGLTWFLIQPGEPHSAYCSTCACEYKTQTWVFRPTGRVLWNRETENSTLVSTVLVGKKLVGSHVHRWVTPRVTPNPLSPYLLPVRQSLGLINTSLVAAMLGNFSDYADPQSVRHVCEVVLTPEYSYLINHDLRFHKFPPHGFHDRRQFLTWWQKNAFSFFDHLRDETVPD